VAVFATDDAETAGAVESTGMYVGIGARTTARFMRPLTRD